MEEGWNVIRATCESCAHEWVAVFPDGCTEVECSQCGHMTPLGVYVEERHPVPGVN